MRVRIHRGAHEIGGSCVELEADGRHLVLDLGLPLDADLQGELPLPEIVGLSDGDDALEGAVISHSHPDHWGLAEQLGPEVPLYMGEAAARILKEAAFFSPVGADLKPTGFLRDGEILELGPFSVTPLLVDHSAFDAYALLVEADGKRLFYSGDLRAHGRKASVFERLLAEPPSAIDVLLMEGTHVREGADADAVPRSEDDVEDACVALFRATEGMVLVQYSPMNVDRLVTLFRAAKRSRRDFVMDLYAATVAAATGRDTIPQADWEGVRVYLPQTQRWKVINAQAFERTDRVKAARIYADELSSRAGELVLTFRQSLTRELERADCVADAQAVWSLWPGYLDEPAGVETRRWLAEHQIPLTVEHASGHAAVRDLQRLVEALAPDRVIPIHSSAPGLFANFFPRVDSRPDGEWWDV